MHPKERRIEHREARDLQYRKIEAMYHKGYSIDDMVQATRNLERFEVIDIVQCIFGNIQMKKEADYKARAKGRGSRTSTIKPSVEVL